MGLDRYCRFNNSIGFYYWVFDFGSNSSFVEEEKVAVPSNLEGLNKEEAEYALKSAGLVMKIGQPKYSETAKDKFVSSSPKSGTKVKKGSVVTVYFQHANEENTF